ncbi:MAG: dihydrofolate reductase family protein [Actinomycetota bacterium]
MERLVPDPTPLDDDAELDAALRDLERRRPDRAWVLANMVSSLDGAIAVDGVSGSLGGDGDFRLFLAIRAQADVVLVGAGTFRAEEYSPPAGDEATRARRRANGATDVLRLAIVSRSLDLDLDRSAFRSSVSRPLVVTVTDADPHRRDAVAEVADIVEAGTGDVDLGAAVTQLHERGAGVVLAEGGARLNGQLVDADLIDELFLTVSPNLVGGDGPRITRSSATPTLHRFERVHLLAEDDELYLRYRRSR